MPDLKLISFDESKFESELLLKFIPPNENLDELLKKCDKNNLKSLNNYYNSACEHYLTINTLLSFDYLIEAGSNNIVSNEADFAQKLKNLLYLHTKQINIIDRNITWKDIFNEATWKDKSERRRLSFLLLRVLTTGCDSYIKISNLELAFDKFLSKNLPDILKLLKITDKMQTFEKIEKWREYETLLLNKWERISVTSFEQLILIKNDIYSFFKKLNQHYFEFVKFSEIGSFPDNMFKVIERMSENIDQGDQVVAYQDIKILQDMLREAIKVDSLYIRLFFIPIMKVGLISASRLIKKFEKDAILSLIPYDKHYPFFDEDAEIQIRLNLENSGEGTGSQIDINLIFDDVVILSEARSDVHHIYIPTLSPGTIPIVIPLKVIKSSFSDLKVISTISWKNWNNKVKTEEFEFELKCEKKRTNWVKLEEAQRYATNPVKKEKDFYAKASRIDEILRSIKKSTTSWWMFGHKRIGKTSAMFAIERELDKIGDFITVTITAGDFLHEDASQTINLLVERICKEITKKGNLSIPIPTVNNSLIPLKNFIEDVINQTSKKVYFMIDEFDELSDEFYEPSALSKPFFNTLRAMSQSDNIGFMLIGGEDINKLKTVWGQSFNLLKVKNLESFNLDDYDDYVSMIKQPVIDELDFTDDSIQLLFQQTNGHPFFTKLICQTVQELSCKKHDSWITAYEMEEAIDISLNNHIDSAHFQHFVEDGMKIRGRYSDIETLKRNRILFLLSISKLLNAKETLDRSNIKARSAIEGLSGNEFDDSIQEFQERNIIAIKSNHITVNLPIFEKFIDRHGTLEFPKFLPESLELKRRIERDEKLKVKPDEIENMLINWESYQDVPILQQHVQKWLDQFLGKGYQAQRIAFNILKELKFIKLTTIHDLLKYGMSLAQKGVTEKKRKYQRKRDDIYVSYLDNLGKSGAGMATRFKNVNELPLKCLVEFSKISRAIKNEKHDYFDAINTFVFVDDIICSGNNLSDLINIHKSFLRELSEIEHMKVLLFTLFGFESGIERIRKKLEELDLNVEFQIGSQLDENEKIFSTNSRYFEDEDKKKDAKAIISYYGEKIESKTPLGYSDFQLGVVFPDNCPNNSLPILRGSIRSANFNWDPIFYRRSSY